MVQAFRLPSNLPPMLDDRVNVVWEEGGNEPKDESDQLNDSPI